MPHNLTETAAWTPNVSVPNAADDGAARHALGEAAWQALANRTQALKVLADAALPKSGGTVTGNVTVNGNLAVAGSTHNLSVDGSATVTGNLTVNNKLTVAQNVTLNGNAISITNGSVTLGAGSVHVQSGGVDAAADIATTGGDIILPSGKRLKYSSPVAKFRRVRLAGASANQPAPAVVFTGGHWGVNNTAYTLSIPLPPLSSNTEIIAVWIRYSASGAGGTVELVKHTITDWGVTGGVTPNSTALPGSGGTMTVGGGVKTALLNLSSPYVVSNTGDDLWIRVTGDASATHNIYGAQLTVKLYSPGID